MGYNVAILGATGAVGLEFLKLFEKRSFPIGELRLLASARSAGRELMYSGKAHPVEEVTARAFQGIDFAFFSAGASRSREWCQTALDAGCRVIDNSSAYRMDPSVPLVVPEVNRDTLKADTRLVANPNCTAAILLMAIAPLRKLGALDRLIISTYQSASGAGAQAMEELEQQTAATLRGEILQPKILPHPYAFNLFSHNTEIGPDGQNDEERKVAEESRKILSDQNLKFNVTCVRVPVMRAHSISATIEFKGPAPELESIFDVLDGSPGVRIVHNPAQNHFPMPIEASGQDEVLVGRIRHDLSNSNAVCLFISGDQLLKGAALNAVQIAESMIASGLVPLRVSSS